MPIMEFVKRLVWYSENYPHDYRTHCRRIKLAAGRRCTVSHGRFRRLFGRSTEAAVFYDRKRADTITRRFRSVRSRNADYRSERDDNVVVMPLCEFVFGRGQNVSDRLVRTNFSTRQTTRGRSFEYSCLTYCRFHGNSIA